MTADLAQRITDYLASGGLFNPELANHDAVRDLLIECRDAFLAPAEGDALPPLPTPDVQRAEWDEPDAQTDEGLYCIGWSQYHDENDPLPDQWDDVAPTRVVDLFTAAQMQDYARAASKVQPKGMPSLDEIYKAWHAIGADVAGLEWAKFAALLSVTQAPAPAQGSWVNADDVHRLVREMDVALNGDMAAPQAQLCDIAAEVKARCSPLTAEWATELIGRHASDRLLGALLQVNSAGTRREASKDVIEFMNAIMRPAAVQAPAVQHGEEQS